MHTRHMNVNSFESMSINYTVSVLTMFYRQSKCTLSPFWRICNIFLSIYFSLTPALTWSPSLDGQQKHLLANFRYRLNIDVTVWDVQG